MTMKSSTHRPTDQVGGSKEEDPSRIEEAQERHAEYGVVGWVENDESNYDRRQSPDKQINSSSTPSNSGDDHKSGTKTHPKDKYGKTPNDGHIKFSNKLFGRDKELAQLELLYQNAMGLNDSKEDADANGEDRGEAQNKDGKNSTTFGEKIKSKGPLQVVFLKGFSGCGKTAFLMEAVERIQGKFSNSPKAKDNVLGTKSNGNILIHGKHDLLQHIPIPYKALIVALKRWYRSLSPTEKRALIHVQHDLEKALGGDDQQHLADILPFLSQVIMGYDDASVAETETESPGSVVSIRTHADKYYSDPMNTARVQFAFQCLFQSMCRHSEAPLILFLDDLQWADPYSLELLASLLSPKSMSEQHLAITGMVFVGAYRENEVTPPLVKLLDTLHNNAPSGESDQQPNVPITTIAISDLGQEDLGAFVADTLQLPSEEVLPLTNILFEKTMGNMYFARQALEELVRQNALYYDMMTFQWQWAAAPVLAKKLTSDITEIIRSKIQALPVKLQRIFLVASFLGQHFDIDILTDILKPTNKGKAIEMEAKSDIQPLLDQAVKEGLLAKSVDSTGSIDFSFAHDRVQEVTQTMTMAKELDHDHEQLMVIIGNVLVGKSTVNGNDDGTTIIADRTTFFLGIHHLNMGTKDKIDSQEEVIRLAELNLHAAKESIVEAAYESAVNFAKRGIRCIDENYNGEIWLSHRELMHELHQVAAEACRLSGDHASMEAYCKACLEAEKDRPLDELFSIYYTLANGLTYGTNRTNRLNEGKAILLKLLDHLGCRLPRSFIRKLPAVVKEILGLVMFKKRLKPGTIENMEFVQDSNQIEMVKLLQKLGELTYITSDDLTMALTRFASVNHCLKHGITPFTACDVASIAVIFAGPLNDLQSARAYVEYGIALMDRIRHKPLEPIAYFLMYGFGLPWTTPVAKCIAPLKEGYQTGINTGMLEHAVSCGFGAMTLSFLAGEPLAELDAIWIQQIPRMEGWGHMIPLYLIKGLSRIIMAVRGVSRDHITSLEDFSQDDDVPPAIHETLLSYERIEWSLLGEHALCADEVVKKKDALIQAAPASPALHADIRFSGLSCWHMYRTTRKNKYRRQARRIYRLVGSWAKQGNPNVLHWMALYDAENAFVHHRAKVADEKYSLAIKLALDGGYRQDAAVIYEHWGICTLEMANTKNEVHQEHAIGDSPASKAAERMKEAVRLYSIWGAFEIVRRLKERYPVLLSN